MGGGVYFREVFVLRRGRLSREYVSRVEGWE